MGKLQKLSRKQSRGLNRDILKLALPSILANITVPLVGIVDIAIAGHLDYNGAAALIGAIAVGSMLFDLLYWNFNFLRAGTGGLTAQAVGRNDMRECANILSRSIGTSFLIAAFIAIIAWPFTKAAFLMISCSPEVKKLALDYFFIRIIAAPATLSLMTLKGWFIGMQDGVSSMASDLVVNLSNIFLSFVLAMGIHIAPTNALMGIEGLNFGGLSINGMGFNGIAWGTVIAQYAGFIFASAIVFIKYSKKVFSGFRLHQLKGSFSDGKLGSFIKMNSDLFIRSFCLILIYIGFTMISARYGDLLLAASAIIMKILMIFSYFTDGFAYAGEALVGKYIGMGSVYMTRKTTSRTFIWSMSIGMFFVILYGVAATPLLKIMTSDADVIYVAKSFIPWLIVMPLLGCPAFTWDGVYVGATATKEIRNSSIWSAVGFFAVWFLGIGIVNMFISPDSIISGGNPVSGTIVPDIAERNLYAIHILMAAYFMHLLVRTVYQSILYKKSILTAPFKNN